MGAIVGGSKKKRGGEREEEVAPGAAGELTESRLRDVVSGDGQSVLPGCGDLWTGHSNSGSSEQRVQQCACSS